MITGTLARVPQEAERVSGLQPESDRIGARYSEGVCHLHQSATLFRARRTLNNPDGSQ